MPAALVSVRPGHLYLLPPRKKTCTESCLFVAFPAGFCYNDTKSRFHKHSTPLMKTDPKILLRKAGVRMPNILILGGGAAGLAAALAAAQSAPAAQVIVLERNPKPGKKLLATGNGRCNLDNTGIAPELYFTADPAALRPLLDAVNTADPLRWFRALGLYTRTDEAGRVYPYSNQAADVLALLMAADEPFSVFEANCQCFTNRPLIGIITKIDSPYANVPMVRNWMVNSGCERIFEVSNLTREGIQELLDYLQEDPVRLTLEQAKARQRLGLTEWEDASRFGLA